jgi:hypothetical protein
LSDFTFGLPELENPQLRATNSYPHEEERMATQDNTPSVQDSHLEGSNRGYAEIFAPFDRTDSSLRHDDERASRTKLTESGPADEAAGGQRVYRPHRPSNATENTVLEPTMGVLDVASVIINKMVGTGIFTVPGQVLVSTGDKGTSLVLWAMGGIWTAAWYSSEIS